MGHYFCPLYCTIIALTIESTLLTPVANTEGFLCFLNYRKKKIEAEMESGGDTPNLYTVLPEKRSEKGIGASMMGSTHTYEMGRTSTKQVRGMED